MNNWSVIGLLSCLGVASFAHAHSSAGSGSPSRARVFAPALRGASHFEAHRAGGAPPPRSKAQARFGEISCHPAGIKRADMGLDNFLAVPATGGKFSVIVDAMDCGWSISEDADMLTNLTPTSGSGRATSVAAVTSTFTVLPNTGAARVGVIKSGGVPAFEIRQAASATYVPPPPPPPPLSNDASLLGAARTCGTIAMTTVKSGATFKPDTYVLSPSRQYKLIYQTDGNLVLYRANGQFVWNNGKTNTGGKLVMQTDGNLVSYNAAGKALWGSLTSKNPGAFLGVQDDGNVVVYAVNSCEWLWDIH